MCSPEHLLLLGTSSVAFKMKIKVFSCRICCSWAFLVLKQSIAMILLFLKCYYACELILLFEDLACSLIFWNSAFVVIYGYIFIFKAYPDYSCLYLLPSFLSTLQSSTAKYEAICSSKSSPRKCRQKAKVYTTRKMSFCLSQEWN